jgi:hypothetical protein
LVTVLALSLQGALQAAPQDWNEVSRLHRGAHVTVKCQRGLGGKVEGAFVRSDSDNITLQTDGGELVIPRSKARKIREKRKWYDFWIGAGTYVFLGAYLDGHPTVYAAPREADPSPAGDKAAGVPTQQ